MSGDAEAWGPFKGEVAAAFAHPELVAWARALGRAGATAAASRGQGGTRVFEASAPGPQGPIAVVVKAFPRQAVWKDAADRKRGSAAERSWRVARRLHGAGVGTPAPVVWLERWSGGRLAEAYFVTQRVEAAGNFRDELMHLLRHEPMVERLLGLLREVAAAVRSLHDAGVMHGDLGNQNILLRRTGDDRWEEVRFVDLNRARLFEGPVPLRARACDLSRVFLPSDLLRIFLQMYFGGRIPPAFAQMEGAYRRRFAWHSRSRVLRHPLRQARIRRATEPDRRYPLPRDLWIWDEKSAQPINAWRRPQRERMYPWGNYRLMAGALLSRGAAVWRAYRDLLPVAYGEPVPLAGRFALAVEPRPDRWEKERAWLAPLAGVPLLLRVYRHKGTRQWDYAVQVARELALAGHPVALALVQDRRSVREPAAWAAMCERVVPQVASFVDWVEVGHAVNRVKWGLWELRDYRHMVQPLVALREAFPSLRLMGPGGIDFEYPHVLGALASLPASFRFDAISHHLYVDRRGAPEHRQGGLASLEKFALARALARACGRSEDRLIISEVNWPLAGTGVYSPVCSPFLYPGQVVGAPNVSEADYADYMVRYLLQAACSGFVERVYWWRLAARGFGLVDDVEEPDRARPAYHAFVQLLRVLGAATFQRNLPSPPGALAHLFLRPDGEQVVAAYAWGGDTAWNPPFAWRRVEDSGGAPSDAAPVALGGHPVYFRGVTS